VSEQAPNPSDERSWLYNHIGRLSGTVLGLLVMLFIALLAINGYEPAITLLVIIVAGFLMISIGGKLRGGTR
jgi:4-hydroxybenzoate polyprenyltransferase